MNWDAVGAIGEIVGASAVVISVAYLAFQIKKQTDESRLAATREVAAQLQSLMTSISDDEKTAEIWLKGVQEFNSLPNVERIRAAMLFQRVTRIMEQQFRHTVQSQIDPKFFTSVDTMYSEFLRFPGSQQWWEGSKAQYEREFRVRVDRMIVESKEKGYESSFQSAPANQGAIGDA